MENIISGILEAEASAAQMIEEARASALLVVAEANAEAARLKEAQQKAWIKECEMMILHAQADALNSKYSAVEDAMGEAGAMVAATTDSLDGVSEKFFGKILGR